MSDVRDIPLVEPLYPSALVERLRRVLGAVALMDRPGEVKREEACRRGYASDMTILMSQDFRDAADVYVTLFGVSAEDDRTR